ncbi:MAG: lysophospholipid acyltransferase family protein [Candidatus Sabulitectum sp.]|nr:lysophospholipid acyltransferase family protein [Candidatus Sabulitectum sp.]
MKKIPFKTLRHALTVPAVKLVIFAAAVTPRPISRFNAGMAGWILSILPLPSNRIIKKHQQIIMADQNIHATVAGIYTSVLAGFFDFFYLSYRSDGAFKRIVKVNGADNMEEALSFGKGVIAVTAHFGPWELLPRAMKLLGFEIGVVGRSLSLKGASDVLEKLRRKPGIHTIDRDAGAAPVLRLLRKNNSLGILIDQNTKGIQSESVDFLGHPARTPVAPAVLAKRLEVPVVTMHITRQKDSTYLLEIDEPVFFTKNDSISDALTLLNGRISQWIMNAPEQWVWFHDRWRK